MGLLERDRKWWLEWAFGYLVMVPLFALGVYVAIEIGLGLGLGMFVGAGFGMSPILLGFLWSEMKEKKQRERNRARGFLRALGNPRLPIIFSLLEKGSRCFLATLYRCVLATIALFRRDKGGRKRGGRK